MKNHWGWWWKIKHKYKPKGLCSNFNQIDSFMIFKNPDVNYFAVQSAVNTIHSADLVTFTREQNCLKITHGKREHHSYVLYIEKVPCFFGGYRIYFKCPSCHTRMRILYMVNGAFLCRKCLNLGYLSQRLRPTDRHDHKSQKIISVIKKRGGEHPFIKPPRMQALTFQRLKNLATYYKQKSLHAGQEELRQWYGNKIEPYLEPSFDYVDESLK